MFTVGIDCGSQNTKGVLMDGERIIAMAKTLTEFDAEKAAQDVYESLLAEAGADESKVADIVATGTGRDIIKISSKIVNQVDSASRGASYIKPDTGLVIDMGAESSRVIRLAEDGRIKKYESNDKCASGAGTFIEAMSRALQIKTEEMGDYSLRHRKEIVTNSQCVVFAESEVISLIHQQESIEDIAYGIHIGICNRIFSLVRRVGNGDNVTMIGGPGHNKGLVKCMEKVVGREIFVPEETDFVSAIGAAVCAMDQAGQEASQ